MTFGPAQTTLWIVTYMLVKNNEGVLPANGLAVAFKAQQ
jgi:hypothetical protein